MRIMGLDVGDVRVGVALTDILQSIATPFKILEVSDSIFDEIAKLVQEKQVTKIVYGLPISLDGKMKRQVEKVEDFISKLKNYINIDTEPIDERFSTLTARNITNMVKGKKEKRVDSVAASIILESYLHRIRIEKKRISLENS